MLYKTSKTDTANTLFVVYSKDAADAIASQGGQAIAVQTASDTGVVEYLERWAVAHGDAGTIVYWVDREFYQANRKDGITDQAATKYLPGKDYEDINPDFDITQAAAEDPAAFAAEYQDILTAAHQAADRIFSGDTPYCVRIFFAILATFILPRVIAS